MEVEERIRARRGDLSPAERRVADLVLADPHALAFGTVASVATAAGAGAGSVVRFATRLGFDGFAALQDAVRADLRAGGERAASRIRAPQSDDVLVVAAERAADAVRETFGRIDPDRFERAVRVLADRAHPVHVLAADASHGVGEQFATELAMVRPGVSVLGGTPVAVARSVALLEAKATVVVLDLPRYDAWLLDATAAARAAGVRVVAITGSELSPLAEGAEVVLTVASSAAGPFDSHVAAVAVFEALVAGVARRLRRSATDRLERIESAWHAAYALRDH